MREKLGEIVFRLKIDFNNGFTLIELVISISIICILVAAALPMYVNYIEDSKIGRAQADIKVILDALIRYRHEYSFDPFYQLSDLIGRYLNKVPIDPWGREYRIDALDGVIMCAGPDGEFKTDDDVDETYPNPRVKVALLKDTENFNGVIQLTIEGRLTSPRATLEHSGGLAFPVALASHFRDELDFRLNYVLSNIQPLRFPDLAEALYPIDDYQVIGLQSVFNRPYDKLGFLREDAYGRFSMSWLLVPEEDAQEFCYYMSIIRKWQVKYLGENGKIYEMNARSTLPEAYYYRPGFGPFGLAVLCQDRRDGGAVAEIERFDYWQFESVKT